MNIMTKYPLSHYTDNWNPLPQHMVSCLVTVNLYSYIWINNTASVGGSSAPPGMIYIPAISNYTFLVQGVEIEGWELPDGVDFQYPWESHPQRYHNFTMGIDAFYIDKYEVTNAQYKQFLQSSGYWPKDDYNFLKVNTLMGFTLNY